MFLQVWEKEQTFQFNLPPPFSNFFKPNLKVSFCLFISNACLLVTFVPCFDCPFFLGNVG